MSDSRPFSPASLSAFLVAAFGVSAVLQVFKAAAPAGPLTDTFVILRELALFAVTGLLLLIVVRGEQRSLASVGLHTRHWGRSLLVSLLVYLLCMAAAVGAIGISHAVGFAAPESMASRYGQVSFWTMTLVTVRAGVVEEICYRGVLQAWLERVQDHWAVSVVLPSVFFGLLHASQGPRGILVAFAVGLVMAVAYRRTRDLKANILAHFLIDFISNVLPRFTH
jgi:membrane protease YdiL (CAAX protease family)